MDDDPDDQRRPNEIVVDLPADEDAVDSDDVQAELEASEGEAEPFDPERRRRRRERLEQEEQENSQLRPRPKLAPFHAELDVSEIDDRQRPGPTWACRATGLSRSSLMLTSRRMCYTGRSLMVAVHLIDDEPTPLYGRVYHCEYSMDGLYMVDLDLEPVPDSGAIRSWLKAHSSNRHPI